LLRQLGLPARPLRNVPRAVHAVRVGHLDLGALDGKRFHTINFDAGRSTYADGKQPPGCPKRESGHLGMHTVDLPAEKGGMHVWITYREGQEVTAEYAASFSSEGVTKGLGTPAKAKR
jgi:hypothetical protein